MSHPGEEGAMELVGLFPPPPAGGGVVSPTWGETDFPACLMALPAFMEGSTLPWAVTTDPQGHVLLSRSPFAFIYFRLHFSEGGTVV